MGDRKAYRYWLERDLGEGSGTLAFVMLNPSTADETEDDPTIRRCIGFAKRESARRLVVANLFAWRATKPAGLLRALVDADDPKGLRRSWLRALSIPNARTVVAWGVGGGIRSVVRMIDDRAGRFAGTAHQLDRPLYCLGKTKSGYPRHPLYLRADTKLEPFEIR